MFGLDILAFLLLRFAVTSEFVVRDNLAHLLILPPRAVNQMDHIDNAPVARRQERRRQCNIANIPPAIS
jgi:hypothetical protein